MLFLIKSLKDSNILQIRPQFYHVTTANYLKGLANSTLNSDMQLYSVPLEQKAEIIGHLLSLNITVQEVNVFPDLPKRKKELYYKFTEDEQLEISFTYSTDGVSLIKLYLARFNDETCTWFIQKASKELWEEIRNEFQKLEYTLMLDCAMPIAKPKILTVSFLFINFVFDFY